MSESDQNSIYQKVDMLERYQQQMVDEILNDIQPVINGIFNVLPLSNDNLDIINVTYDDNDSSGQTVVIFTCVIKSDQITISIGIPSHLVVQNDQQAVEQYLQSLNEDDGGLDSLPLALDEEHEEHVDTTADSEDNKKQNDPYYDEDFDVTITTPHSTNYQ